MAPAPQYSYTTALVEPFIQEVRQRQQQEQEQEEQRIDDDDDDVEESVKTWLTAIVDVWYAYRPLNVRNYSKSNSRILRRFRIRENQSEGRECQPISDAE